MIYEIVTAPKSDLPTEEALLKALAKEKKGFTVENIDSDESDWTIRLAADDDVPPFLKKKKDDSEDSSDTTDEKDDSDSEDSDDSDDSDDSEDGEKSDSKKNPAAEVKAVIDQLTGLFSELGGKVEDLQSAHDEKADKLKDIGDTVGEDHGGPPGGDVADIGPTPGGPPAPPMPGLGMDHRKKPVPGAPGGGLPTFTNYQVATHPGVNESGERISLTAAATALEADPDFENYEVVGMTENADGTFSAKLKLRELRR